ncbi:hypothetical protein [Gilliamella sp. Gris1-4]|uniref:hypothetical protein n=1 Tax=Gilliamella sp. Gris1-4 TaxID=3120244 RepID=UPI00080D8E10|nr:hypothetical protein [Gilliamella apicola]OCG38080.1 hypothetical protein A9G31_02960 [Gilliamella apicola]OCG65755.1 hypothetical protein A9G39_08450 [Gilliamella apicola]OCG68129.1 hypothetical protein A9G39_03435 [Gilliamella apicola]
MFVDGVIFLPSGNSIAKKVSVSIAFVCPPSNVKYGAVPLIKLFVVTDNACAPCVYDNNNNGAKNNADLDNNEGLNNNRSLNSNGGLNNHLDIDDNFVENMADGVTEEVFKNVVEESVEDIASKAPDDGVDFATQNDFDDENNCGALF